MKKYKSHKIEEVIKKNDDDLNLHEIKAKTGAGNGYKNITTNVEAGEEICDCKKPHKSYKIKHVINKHDGNLNLHEIKAKTGAGSGYKH
ncbi:hypothetical protein [Clostridium sp.]|uniref:hypothetical protein n=1 Tax=Clostridium sp. TaxID=1506 RepID=UPI0025C6706B|nr:hypothetical protein [Clostridium sp.]MCI9069657.1 hypothetical protein [Clostridium sp.]